MSILCWNCQGLGLTRAVTSLRNLLRITQPHLVFLSETRSTKQRMESLRVQLGFPNGLFVERHNRGGGLALFWTVAWDVRIQSFSTGHIDAWITQEDGFRWRFTGFYAAPNDALREHSWSLLRRLSSLYTLPWLCAGDFNQILYPHEKIGGLPPNRRLMSSFQLTLEHCDLHDLGYTGPLCTWSNKRPIGLVTERLDRAVATPTWISHFPSFSVQNHVASNSDHLAVSIMLLPSSQGQKSWFHLPRYEPFWLKDEEFYSQFQSYWCKPHSAATANNSIIKARTKLCKWSFNKYKNLHASVQAARNSLQQALLQPSTSVATLHFLQRHLAQLEDKEEIFWSQRARTDWLLQGDKNTSYFHRKASSRREKNRIDRVQNQEGALVDDEHGVENIIHEFYSNLFTALPSRSELDTSLPFKQLSSDDQDLLATPFSAEELLIALKQLAPHKSPGPDGMQPVILQKTWNIIGNDLMAVALNILNGPESVASLNQTYITLIPKVRTPLMVTDFRPIGLCNTLYKLISRTIVNRLKKVIDTLIDESQSAFIEGRFITDNAIIAFEAFHSMQINRSRSEEMMRVKLDLAKAFDRVDWVYLDQIMQAMHFPDKFRTLIMRCITSANFSVLINGKPTRTIMPSRGIRQGDPLSPFLFLLCAEGLSALLRKEENAGHWKGMKFGREGPNVSHLLFADDSLLFCEATDDMVSTLQRTLSAYMSMSGQVINFDKSHLYFSLNVVQARRQQLCERLGMAAGLGVGKYLGLPFMTGRNKKEIFQYVEDRIRKKLTGWKERTLTQAGKEVLIKSVIQSIPNFVMQCFELPASICNTITSLTRHFWWSTNAHTKPVYWKSWDNLCQSKLLGGMGFREIHTFNLAMLGKTAWNIWSKPLSLVSRCLQAKYYASMNFLSADFGSRPSFLWRSLLAGRDVLQQGLRYRVGNGENILAFNSKWIPRPYSFKPISPNPFQPYDFPIQDLIDWDLLQWRYDLLSQVFLPMDTEEILKIPLSREGHADSLIWHFTKSGIYTVKSANRMLQERKMEHAAVASSSTCSQNVHFWKQLWKLQCLPRAKNFLWKAVSNILPTSFNLGTRIKTIPMACPLCGTPQETDLHALFECAWADSIWDVSAYGSRLGKIKATSFQDLMSSVFQWPDEKEICTFVHLCWLLWKTRCSLVFGGGFTHKNALESEARAITSALFDAPATGYSMPCSSLIDKWEPPSQGEFSINGDASFAATGRVCACLIVRDDQGQIITASTQQLPNGIEVDHGELLAIFHGLALGISLNLKAVVIWTDSLTCHKLLLESPPPYHPLISLLAECHRLACMFEHCTFQFVRREGNMPSHLLATYGLNYGESFTWNRCLPDCILSAVNADLFPNE